MNFEHRCLIPAGREPLWDFLMDVPRMAVCVPGVEGVTLRGGDDYEGQMRVRIGPIGLTLHGTVTIEARDAAAGTASVRAEASDRRAGGGVNARAWMTLLPRSAAETELAVRAEARLLGRLGEFGQAVIRKKAEAMLAEFAQNVAVRLAEGASPDA